MGAQGKRGGGLSEKPTYLDLIDEVLIEQYPQLTDKKRERP